MNIFYYSSGPDPSNPTGLRYDGSLYQGSPGLCSPASANTLVSNAPVIAAAGPYGPPLPAPGGRALDLVVAPSTVLSLLAPHIQSTNFCASAAYRMKTPYMLWPKLFRSRDRVDKTVRCEPCDMVLNSEQQAKQHFNGKHHLRRMRKMKINSSTAAAADDRCPEDLKRSRCKMDATGKKTRLKKHHGARSEEDTVEPTPNVSSNGDPASEEMEESRDGESATSERLKADVVHMQQLENNDSSKDRTMFGGLDKADSAAEPTPASSGDLSRSNIESASTSSCFTSSHTNCTLVESDRQAPDCPSMSCITPNHRCSFLKDSAVYIPNAPCYGSPLRSQVLCQSSLQSSHVMSSVSSGFKMTASCLTTTSRDNDIISTGATPFVPGFLLPRS